MVRWPPVFMPQIDLRMKRIGLTVLVQKCYSPRTVRLFLGGCLYFWGWVIDVPGLLAYQRFSSSFHGPNH